MGDSGENYTMDTDPHNLSVGDGRTPTWNSTEHPPYDGLESSTSEDLDSPDKQQDSCCPTLSSYLCSCLPWCKNPCRVKLDDGAYQPLNTDG